MASLETAIVASLLIALTFTIIQATLYFHARNVANNAAQVGVEAARVFGGSSSAGNSAASGFLDQVSPSLFATRSVSTSRTATTATTQVTATTPSLVPGLRLPTIEAAATAAVERTTDP